MDLKERIKRFSDSIGFSIREFERACGLTRGNISNMTGALGSDKLAKIIDTYPELNLYWLLTGQGEMIREELSAPMVAPPTIIYERDPRDIQLIAAQEKTIARDEELIASLRQIIGNLEHGSNPRGFSAPSAKPTTPPSSTQSLLK